MRVIVTSHGFEYIEDRYRAAGGRARLIEPALELIGEDMMKKTATQFESGGRRLGGSWAFGSEEWRKRKARRGLDPRPLFATGKLFRSVTEPRDPDMILDIVGSNLKFGSRLIYADTHQHGDESRGIPARPFIAFSPLDLRKWTRIVTGYILDPTRRRG